MLEKSSTSYLGAGCRGFESRHSDHIGTQVLIRYLRSFSFLPKTAWYKAFRHFCKCDSFHCIKIKHPKVDAEGLKPTPFSNV